ncbi:MAG: DUF4178 domain-containing protein [Cytophagales bacterium]|nr:DUF4178 domain-containing protein [Cytophagales bacterium]
MYIDCPKCHQTTLSPYDYEELSIRCKNCNTAISKVGEQVKFHEFLGEEKPLIPLQVGQIGHLNGRQYKVLAWSVYRGIHEDSEWSWTEWLLIDQQQNFQWLSFSMEEGFLLFDHLETYSMNFRSVGEYIPTPDGDLPIIDDITAELKNFDGCLPWVTHHFHTYDYYSAVKNNHFYSLEIFHDEASLFKGGQISPQIIEDAFKLPKLHNYLPWNQKVGYFINQFFK